MRTSRNLKDDALFLGAFATMLVGVGLLLETTEVLLLPGWGFSILVMAASGLSLWLCVVRGHSAVFLGAGVGLGLSGIVLLLAAFGPGLVRTWPLLMSSAGFGWLAYGLRRYRRLQAAIVAPASTLILLGLFFALFSLAIVTVRLATFVATWWPLLFIIGGISMFVAWSLRSGKKRSKRRVAEP